MPMQFYTTESLGAKRAMTPEGFMLCMDVPIGRCGEMVYGAHEIPKVTPDAQGLIHIRRDPDEVFKDEFIASFVGKPVVNDHPDDNVNPENWRELCWGVVLNPRRGVNEFADCMVADLLITTVEDIAAVNAGKREVSSGYEADYQEIGPGMGRQLNMIGNHVAIVDAGRCGTRCAIGDKHSVKGDLEMTTTHDDKMGWLDRMLAALSIKDKDAAIKAASAVVDEAKAEAKEPRAGGGDVHVHLTGDRKTADEDPDMSERMKKIEDKVSSFDNALTEIKDMLKSRDSDPDKDKDKDEEKAKEKATGDALEEETGTKDARTAKDSALLADSFQTAVSNAEILVPGITFPTFDAKLSPVQTLDGVCRLRRKALDLAYVTPEGRELIEQIHGKPLTTDGMSCGAVRTLFNAAAAAKKASNNARTQDTGLHNRTGAGMQVHGAVRTLADLNKANGDYWKNRNGGNR